MMKSVSVFAIMMALSMTAAVAKDPKQDQKAPPAPAVKGQVMSDSDMDKVTAGGIGHHYEFGRIGGQGFDNNNGLGKFH